jgi:hypothetical protein
VQTGAIGGIVGVTVGGMTGVVGVADISGARVGGGSTVGRLVGVAIGGNVGISAGQGVGVK